MSIEPTFDRMIVEVDEFTQTASGLYTPGAENTATIVVTILATGPNCSIKNAEGKKAVIGRYSGVEIDGLTIAVKGSSETKSRKLILCDKDILAIIE